MAERIYKSKVDTWIGVILYATCAVLVFSLFSIQDTAHPIVTVTFQVVMLASLILVVWTLRATHYAIEIDHLKIVSGPFRWTVPFGSITSIEPSGSPLSSPALSLDRLHVSYEGSSYGLLVSPKQKQEFLTEMARRCPHAKITTSSPA